MLKCWSAQAGGTKPKWKSEQLLVGHGAYHIVGLNVLSELKHPVTQTFINPLVIIKLCLAL